MQHETHKPYLLVVLGPEDTAVHCTVLRPACGVPTVYVSIAWRDPRPHIPEQQLLPASQLQPPQPSEALAHTYSPPVEAHRLPPAATAHAPIDSTYELHCKQHIHICLDLYYCILVPLSLCNPQSVVFQAAIHTIFLSYERM